MMDRLDDDIGLDTIEMGVTIGVAMEAGLIQFGDAQGAIRLLQGGRQGHAAGPDPRQRRGGDRQGSSASSGSRWSRARPCRPTIRAAIQGIGVTYATTTDGRRPHRRLRHRRPTSSTSAATSIPLKAEGQIELSRNLQIATAAIDSTGMCLFIAFAILDQPDTFQALLDMLNAFYGAPLTGDDVVALGKSVLKRSATSTPRPASRRTGPAAGFLQEREARRRTRSPSS